MADRFVISTILKVLDQSTEPLRKVGRAWGNLSEKISKSQKQFQKAGKRMTDVGKTMSTRLTLPIVGFGASIIRTASQFQNAMNEVNAITRASAKQFEDLEEKALKLGRSTKWTSTEVAQAMKFLGMAGLETDQILGAIGNTLKLATAGNIDLAAAADIATNVMTSMSLSVEDLNRVNNALAITATSTNTNIIELSEAMKTSAGMADAFGIDLETLTAALGKMASGGDKASIAGTLFRNALSLLLKGGPKVQRLMEGLGTSLDDFVTKSGKIKNIDILVDKIREFQDAGGNALLVSEAFGERGGRAMINLAKTGKKSFGDLIKDFKNAGNVTDEMVEKMERGLPDAIRKFKSAFEGMQHSIAKSGFAEQIEKIIRGLTEWMQEISDANPELLAFGTILFSVAAALGPVLTGIGQFVFFAPGMIKAIKGIGTAFLFLGKVILKAGLLMLANPIVLVIVALTAAFAALWIWRDKIANFFEEIFKWFNELSPAMQVVVAAISLLFKPLLIAIGYVYTLAKLFQSFAKRGVSGTFKLIWKKITDTIREAWDNMKGFFKEIWEGIVIKARNVGNSLVNAIVSPFEALGKTLDDLWKDIVSGFDRLVKELPDWAKGILGVEAKLEKREFSAGRMGATIQSTRSETDVTIKVEAGEGTAASIDKVRTKGSVKPVINVTSMLGALIP